MKIQSINADSKIDYNNQKNTSFKCLWSTMGENYLNRYQFHGAAMYPCVNGIKIPKIDTFNGTKISVFNNMNPLTVEQCRDAYQFLFNNTRNPRSYDAIKQLKNFIEASLASNGHHNTLFLDENDSNDPNGAKKEIRLTDIIVQIHDYELKNGLVSESTTNIKPEEPIDFDNLLNPDPTA